MNILFGRNSLSRLWISYKSVLCLKFQVLSAPPPGSPSIKPPTSSTGMFLRSNFLGNWENLGLQNHQFFPKIVVNFPKVCPQQFSQFLPAASVVKCLHPPILTIPFDPCCFPHTDSELPSFWHFALRWRYEASWCASAELRAGKVEKVSTTPQILLFFSVVPKG